MTNDRLQQYAEFLLEQIWQPAKTNIVSRTITAFTPDAAVDDGVIIKYTTAGGRKQQCSLRQMRSWIKKNCAIGKPTITNNSSTALVNIEEIDPLIEPEKTSPLVRSTFAELISSTTGTDVPVQQYFSKYDRCVMFIDGSYLHAMERELVQIVDYRRMLEFFRASTHLVHARYYIPVTIYRRAKRLIDWLSYNGYLVNIIDADSVNTQIFVQMATDMLTTDERITHAIIIAGHRTMAPVISAVKAKGIVASVLGLRGLSDDAMRRCADNFVNFDCLMQVGNFIRPVNNTSKVAAAE